MQQLGLRIPRKWLYIYSEQEDRVFVQRLGPTNASTISKAAVYYCSIVSSVQHKKSFSNEKLFQKGVAFPTGMLILIHIAI